MAPIFQRRSVVSAPRISTSHWEDFQIEIVQVPEYVQLDKQTTIQNWRAEVQAQATFDSVVSFSFTPINELDDEETVEESNANEVVIEEIFDSYFFSDSCDSVSLGGPGADTIAAPFVEALEKTVGKNPFHKPSLKLVIPQFGSSLDDTVEDHDGLVDKIEIETGKRHFPREHCTCEKCSLFYKEYEIRLIMNALPPSTVPARLLEHFDAFHARQERQQIDWLQEPSYYKFQTDFDRWDDHISKAYAQREEDFEQDERIFLLLDSYFKLAEGLCIENFIETQYTDYEDADNKPSQKLSSPFEDLVAQTLDDEDREFNELCDLYLSETSEKKPLTDKEADELLDLLEKLDFFEECKST